MTFTMSISATRPSYPRKDFIKILCLQKSRPVVFRPQLSMGLAFAKIKKASEKEFTLGSYMSIILFFSPTTLSPEIRNRIIGFRQIWRRADLLITKCIY